VTTVMLTIWPRTRIVDAEPDVNPYWLLLTELMIVFMFGDEKSENPNPIQINNITISQIGVVALRNANSINPIVHILIPAVARIRGCILSDILPEIGEKIAIIAG